MGQQTAKITKQLLALCGQDQAAADAIEKPQAEFLLEVADLSGQSRLGDVHPERRLRDRPQLSNGDERTQAPQIHSHHVCLMDIEIKRNYALDVRLNAADDLRGAALRRR
jgi:hypothetical protein